MCERFCNGEVPGEGLWSIKVVPVLWYGINTVLMIMIHSDQPRFGVGSSKWAGSEKRTAAMSATPINLQNAIFSLWKCYRFCSSSSSSSSSTASFERSCCTVRARQGFVVAPQDLGQVLLAQNAQEGSQLGTFIHRLIANRSRRSGSRVHRQGGTRRGRHGRCSIVGGTRGCRSHVCVNNGKGPNNLLSRRMSADQSEEAGRHQTMSGQLFEVMMCFQAYRQKGRGAKRLELRISDASR